MEIWVECGCAVRFVRLVHLPSCAVREGGEFVSSTPSPRGGQPKPSELNADRALVAILHQICAVRGIKLVSFSDDWILRLTKSGRITHVIGYDFALNSATAKMLCKDKSATSDLLAHVGLPRVEHRIFHGPQLKGYVPSHGNWQVMLKLFNDWGRDVVCKPNEGTGGKNVMRAQSEAELEEAAMEVLTRSRALCLSPFERVDSEYRVAVLDGEMQFVYRKERPALAGDGRRTLRELLIDRLRQAKNFTGEVRGLVNLGDDVEGFERVPAADETVVLNWRHNLGQGAAPKLIEKEAPEVRAIGELALRAVAALGVRLASVDIMATVSGPKVLEINSGIMMENLVRSSSFGQTMAYDFYDRIVCRALDLA